MTQRLDFIDVSHWQKDIDFSKLADQDVLGVIAKATDGTGFKDGQFKVNRAGAESAELAFASYHYLRPGNAAEQMDFYLDFANPDLGSRVVIDFEEETKGKVSVPDLIQAVERIRKQRPDLQITVYGASFLTDSINAYKMSDISKLAGTSLWAARYSTTNRPVVATVVWPTWSAWQYSDAGKLKGISTAVDLNTFNGNRDNALKWLVGEQQPPAPAPAPTDNVVSIAIDTPDGVEIHLTINGELVPT